MELDSRKKSRRDRMMRSNSFDTQEVREIGQKETEEMRSFPILWMGIEEDVFQMEGKKCKYQKTLKMRKKNQCQSKEGSLAWGRQLYVGQWQWTRKGCGSHEKFNGGKGGVKRRMRFIRVDGLAELGQVASGSATQGLWYSAKTEADPLGVEQLGKFGEEKDEEKESATERRGE